MRPQLFLFACLAIAAGGTAAAADSGRYLGLDEYLDGAFPAGAPPPATLWITGELRNAVEKALDHGFGALRVRYWYDGTTSAWVLDEIGKEQPITIGVTVAGGSIETVRILEFRESRGWEVRYPFFTDQFRGLRLDPRGRLDRHIDGITGATLSVSAVRRIARVALILHEEIERQE